MRLAHRQSCLQISRLGATARSWQDELSHELERCEDVSVSWAAWHTRIATFLCKVDFAEWPAPNPQRSALAFSAFRDAATLLPCLALDFRLLAPCPSGLPEKLWFCAAGSTLFGRRVKTAGDFHSHVDRIETLSIVL